MAKWKETAARSAEKRALFGPDLAISTYRRDVEGWNDVSSLSELSPDISRQALLTGVRSDEDLRCGTYFQMDHSVIFENVKREFEGKVEILSTREAMEKYDWVKDYWWNAVPVDSDKYTAEAELEWDNGYFLRVLPGQKVAFPMQACLFISQEGISQNVHNLIVAEEGSDVQIITGCASRASAGLHIGVSEFYVKKNASLTFTMIHRWSPGVDVRPRAVAIVEDNATFANNYICLNPLRSLQLYPTVRCVGDNSSATLNSIILGAGDAEIDVGGRIVLKGKNSSGHVVSRCVGKDRSRIHVRGQIIGEGEGKAHIDCRGLILSDEAKIYAIPMLDALVKNCDLSHEAAVGKIKEEELWYLMSRNLSEDEATSLIIKGYLDPGIFGLPAKLKEEIGKIAGMTTEDAM